MYYAPGIQLEGMMKTTRNHNHYNQLLDCLKLGAPKYERQQFTQPPDALTPY